MGRVARTPGQIGEPWAKRRTDGQRGWRGRVEYTGWDGAVKEASGVGATAAEARRAALARAEKRLGGSRTAKASITFAETATEWIEQKSRTLGPQSVRRYEVALGQVLPRLGALRISEVTRRDAQEVLTGLVQREKHPGYARDVIKAVLEHAVWQGHIETNPMHGVKAPAVAKRTQVWLDDTEVRRLIHLLDQEATRRPGQRGRLMRPNLRLAVLTILGTGLRINEALALTWDRLHLEGEAPMLLVAGTLWHADSKWVSEITRSPRPKTDAGERIVMIPGWLAKEFEVHRRHSAYRRLSDPVLATERGGWLDSNNLLQQLHRVTKNEESQNLRKATFVSLRRTVATAVDRRAGTERARMLLGHENEATTLGHYIAKGTAIVDTAGALDWTAETADEPRKNPFPRHNPGILG